MFVHQPRLAPDDRLVLHRPRGDDAAVDDDIEMIRHILKIDGDARFVKRGDLAEPRMKARPPAGDGEAIEMADLGIEHAVLIGDGRGKTAGVQSGRSEEHTSELQSLMRISYADCC